MSQLFSLNSKRVESLFCSNLMLWSPSLYVTFNTIVSPGAVCLLSFTGTIAILFVILSDTTSRFSPKVSLIQLLNPLSLFTTSATGISFVITAPFTKPLRTFMLFTESLIIDAYSANETVLALSNITDSGAFTDVLTICDAVTKCNVALSSSAAALNCGRSATTASDDASAATFICSGSKPEFISINPARITSRPCPITVAIL